MDLELRAESGAEKPPFDATILNLLLLTLTATLSLRFCSCFSFAICMTGPSRRTLDPSAGLKGLISADDCLPSTQSPEDVLCLIWCNVFARVQQVLHPLLQKKSLLPNTGSATQGVLPRLGVREACHARARPPAIGNTGE